MATATRGAAKKPRTAGDERAARIRGLEAAITLKQDELDKANAQRSKNEKAAADEMEAIADGTGTASAAGQYQVAASAFAVRGAKVSTELAGLRSQLTALQRDQASEAEKQRTADLGRVVLERWTALPAIRAGAESVIFAEAKHLAAAQRELANAFDEFEDALMPSIRAVNQGAMKLEDLMDELKRYGVSDPMKLGLIVTPGHHETQALWARWYAERIHPDATPLGLGRELEALLARVR